MQAFPNCCMTRHREPDLSHLEKVAEFYRDEGREGGDAGAEEEDVPVEDDVVAQADPLDDPDVQRAMQMAEVRSLMSQV